jgi:hypothetical protein
MLNTISQTSSISLSLHPHSPVHHQQQAKTDLRKKLAQRRQTAKPADQTSDFYMSTTFFCACYADDVVLLALHVSLL